MTYFIKTEEKELVQLIRDFLFSAGDYSFERVLHAAVNGEGYGFDFFHLFFKGADWDMETESYYFPTPIDDKHALIESTAFVDYDSDDSEIGYIPLEMLYNEFQKVVNETSPRTADIPGLKRMLEELKLKWNID